MTKTTLPPLKKMVYLEDGTLIAMAHNKEALAQFPFLRALREVKEPTGRKCGQCAKKRTENLNLLRAAKQTMATLGPDRKRALCQYLKTEKVRIVLTTSSGVVQTREISAPAT